MSPYLSIPLIAFAAVSFIMILIYIWGRSIPQITGVVDIFWAFNFLVIAAVIWFLADGFVERKVLVCGLASLWSYVSEFTC